MTATFAIVGDNTVDRYLGSLERDFVGGNAVNVAAQLALAGATVAYYGAIGDDADGEYIRATLADTGIDLGGLVVVPGRTAVTTIRVDQQGERSFESEDFGVTADYFPRDEELAEIAAADWVQLGMLRRASELRRALAVRRAVPIGQDCAVAAGFDELRVAFLSAEGADPWPLARAARTGGADLAVVTRGSSGAVALDENERTVEVDAAPATVVDTTGAGDSFIAGFLSEFAHGAGLEQALAAGSRSAAVTCGHLGGFPQSERSAA